VASYGVVGLGGSAGGINVLMQILPVLPAIFQIPILVVQHLRRRAPTSILPTVLGYNTRLRVKWAEDGERPCGGTVYVAPWDRHLTIALGGTLMHVNFCRPAVDPLFQSMATVFGSRAIGR
jgi:two-component system chemotaxis response regulator CheB